MAITTRDQLIAAIAASSKQRYLKTGSTTVAGTFQSLWRLAGQPAAAGSGPANGSSAALTNATAGAMILPAQSNTSYLTGFDAAVSQAGTLILADRIAEFGVNAAVNTSQSMSAVTLPTRASALTDIEMWIEVETALGATQTGNITINYNNQSGSAKSTTASQFAASAPIGRAQPVALTSGDTGVTQVTSVQLTTASTGKLNVVLRRQLCSITIASANVGANLGWPETDLEQIGTAACLELIYLPSTTTAATFTGGYNISMG